MRSFSQAELCWPIPYARSLAQLGRIRAADRRDDEAAEGSEHFLALWGDGDLGATERSAAITFLAAPGPRTLEGLGVLSHQRRGRVDSRIVLRRGHRSAIPEDASPLSHLAPRKLAAGS